MTKVREGPFISNPRNFSYIYATLLVSLIPPMAVAVIYYGLRALVLISFCAVFFALSDAIFGRLLGRGMNSILNSFFEGAVIALLLPSGTPLYAALAGVLFASVFVRNISGGTGSSFVSPAACGRMFIRIVFPLNEKALSMPGEGRLVLKTLLIRSADNVTYDIRDFFISSVIVGRYPSFIGTSCALMLLAGLIYLIAKKTVRAVFPLCFISSLAFLELMRDVILGTDQSLYFFLTSGVLFALTYLMTDNESLMSSGQISIIEALVCAVITFVLSLKTSGIDLIVIPVIICGALNGIFEYGQAVMRKVREDRLNA